MHHQTYQIKEDLEEVNLVNQGDFHITDRFTYNDGFLFLRVTKANAGTSIGALKVFLLH